MENGKKITATLCLNFCLNLIFDVELSNDQYYILILLMVQLAWFNVVWIFTKDQLMFTSDICTFRRLIVSRKVSSPRFYLASQF